MPAKLELVKLTHVLFKVSEHVMVDPVCPSRTKANRVCPEMTPVIAPAEMDVAAAELIP
jgi:hypothetical protein